MVKIMIKNIYTKFYLHIATKNVFVSFAYIWHIIVDVYEVKDSP